MPVNEGLIEGDWKLKLVTTLQKVRNLPQASGLELILIDFCYDLLQITVLYIKLLHYHCPTEDPEQYQFVEMFFIP